jgi:hypothetical protein
MKREQITGMLERRGYINVGPDPSRPSYDRFCLGGRPDIYIGGCFIQNVSCGLGLDYKRSTDGAVEHFIFNNCKYAWRESVHDGPLVAKTKEKELNLVIIERDTAVINTGAIRDSADTALDALSHLCGMLTESIEAISIAIDDLDDDYANLATVRLHDLRGEIENIAGTIEETSMEAEGVYKIVERLNKLAD